MKKKLLHDMEDDDRALATICFERAYKMAARIRRYIVLPYCKKHKLAFDSSTDDGVGIWWFADSQSNIHKVDPSIAEILDFHYSHDAFPIACSIDCVTEEDLK